MLQDALSNCLVIFKPDKTVIANCELGENAR